MPSEVTFKAPVFSNGRFFFREVTGFKINGFFAGHDFVLHRDIENEGFWTVSHLETGFGLGSYGINDPNSHRCKQKAHRFLVDKGRFPFLNAIKKAKKILEGINA